MNFLNKVNINGFSAAKWSSVTRASLLTGVTNDSTLSMMSSSTLTQSSIPLKTKVKWLQSLITFWGAITRELPSLRNLCFWLKQLVMNFSFPLNFVCSTESLKVSAKVLEWEMHSLKPVLSPLKRFEEFRRWCKPCLARSQWRTGILWSRMNQFRCKLIFCLHLRWFLRTR